MHSGMQSQLAFYNYICHTLACNLTQRDIMSFQNASCANTPHGHLELSQQSEQQRLRGQTQLRSRMPSMKSTAEIKNTKAVCSASYTWIVE